MKIIETFVITATRTRDVIEQCYAEVYNDVLTDLPFSERHIEKALNKEGFALNKIKSSIK